MRELRFVAVSEDGRGLVLSDGGGDSGGGEFVLAIDDAIRAAVRQDRSRLGHLHVEAESIRPRDIQARIRAGETAEDVAVAAGIPLEKVRRYEGPVLAEREHVAAQAQSATVRDTGSAEGPAPRLGELLESRFEPLGIDLSVLGWDAWRREDGRWVVRLVYPDRARVRAALWLYDPERRVVLPQDPQARALVDGTEVQGPRARPTAAEQTPNTVRRLASVPREADQIPAFAEESRASAELRGAASEGFALAPTSQDVQLPLDTEPAIDVRVEAAATSDSGLRDGGPRDGGLRPTAESMSANGTDDAGRGGPDTPRHAADPARKPGRAARRAAVPSWDDIVFGTRKKD